MFLQFSSEMQTTRVLIYNHETNARQTLCPLAYHKQTICLMWTSFFSAWLNLIMGNAFKEKVHWSFRKLLHEALVHIELRLKARLSWLIKGLKLGLWKWFVPMSFVKRSQDIFVGNGFFFFFLNLVFFFNLAPAIDSLSLPHPNPWQQVLSRQS